MSNLYIKTARKIILCVTVTLVACSVLSQNAFAVNEWLYTVRKGDTLSEITKRELGMSWYSTNIENEIRRLNPGINVNLIRPTQTIWLPEGRIRESRRLAEEAKAAAEVKAKVKKQEIIEIKEYKQKEIGEAKRRKDLAENQIKILEQNIAELNLKKTQKIESVNMIKAQSRETGQRITIGKQQIEELNKVLEKTDEKIEQKNKEIQKLEQELGEKSKEIERKEHEIGELEQELTKIIGKTEMDTKEIKILETRLTGIFEDIESERQKQRELEIELNKTNKILSELRLRHEEQLRI